MTIPVQDRLYNLLPALYRIRDSEPGQAEALRALMALIEEQFLALEADIDQLYDDAFIETCQEWLVPYIGDLLAVRPLQDTPETRFSQRAYIANTLAYRQRKGTATVLEQLARDVTNWPARAVEYFQRLEWTQHLNHLRPHSWRTPDLRDTNALELLHSPFETAQHTPEVRHIDSDRGKYNISHIGIGLWRLQAYPLEKVQPRPVPSSPGLYWINPLSQDLPLFNTPEPESRIHTLATEINVPAPLRRRPLYDEVKAIAGGQPPLTQYLAGQQPPFQVYLNDEEAPVDPAALMICDLSDVPDSPATNWTRPNAALHVSDRPELRRIAIDPVLGRLAIPQGQPLPASVLISYAYGFSGDIGGGAYDRRASVAQGLSKRVTWERGVSQRDTAVGSELILTDLAEAIAQWNAQDPGTIGAIVLMDNQTYDPGTVPIRVPEGSQLLIVAADWPRVRLPLPDVGEVRRSGQWVPIGRRAHVLGDLAVVGTAPTEAIDPGQLTLDGLLIEGSLTLEAGNLEHLRVAHCTLVPDQGGLVGMASSTEGKTNSRLTIEVDHSITGPLYLPQSLAAIAVNDSVIDAAQGRVWITPALTFPLPAGEFRVAQTGIGTDNSTESVISIPASADLATVQADLEVAFQVLPELDGFRVASAGGREAHRLILVSPVPLTFAATDDDADTVLRLGLLEGPMAIAAPEATEAAPETTLTRTTVFGGSYVQAFSSASEVIWTGAAIAQRRQSGCVRFSYVPPGSRTPRRYRCQPELETERRLALAEREKGKALTAAESALLRELAQRQIVPSFTRSRYGEPAYGQLSRTCPEQIRTGAEDGSEMGVFSFLKQPQREANLRTVLAEYLRFGLEAGLFYIN